MPNFAKIKEGTAAYLELLNRVKLGDKTAFNELCVNYYRLLFNYGYTITSDRELIKDVIQDLFLQLWEKRIGITDIDSIGKYLLKSTRNNILYQIRKNRVNFVDEFIEKDDNQPDNYTIENDIILNETLSQNEARIRKALELLPKRQREVLFLKFYESRSNDEIADLMEINYQSVSNHLQRALSTLRTLLPNNWHIWLISTMITLSFIFA
ncbi:MAG: sigma-70 family RNA polymerase sigma factor [Bacteroidota bacterium]